MLSRSNFTSVPLSRLDSPRKSTYFNQKNQIITAFKHNENLFTNSLRAQFLKLGRFTMVLIILQKQFPTLISPNSAVFSDFSLRFRWYILPAAAKSVPKYFYVP